MSAQIVALITTNSSLVIITVQNVINSIQISLQKNMTSSRKATHKNQL